MRPARSRRPLRAGAAGAGADRVWLFDLDNTLHDAGRWVFGQLREAMGHFTARELGLPFEQARQINVDYWHRYGASLLGLIRHHAVRPAHFLHDTHRLPGLEAQIDGHRHDFDAVARLPGRRYILTNAPKHYALRVLRALGIERLFDGVIGIEQMRVFGQLRPKPDARMLRRLAVALGVPPQRCVLVEDTLVHLKGARRVGMGTVWMQRYNRRGQHAGPWTQRHAMRPAYVDQTVRSLRAMGRGRGT